VAKSRSFTEVLNLSQQEGDVKKSVRGGAGVTGRDKTYQGASQLRKLKKKREIAFYKAMEKRVEKKKKKKEKKKTKAA